MGREGREGRLVARADAVWQPACSASREAAALCSPAHLAFPSLALCPVFVPQGQLLFLAMQLMLGGSLRVALKNPDQLELLRWEERCAGPGLPCPRGVLCLSRWRWRSWRRHLGQHGGKHSRNSVGTSMPPPPPAPQGQTSGS